MDEGKSRSTNRTHWWEFAMIRAEKQNKIEQDPVKEEKRTV